MGPGLTCTVPVARTVLSPQWTRDTICGMDERMIAWIEQCISDQRPVGRGTLHYCRNCTIKRDTWCVLLCTKDEGTPVLSLRQCCATWLLFLLVPCDSLLVHPISAIMQLGWKNGMFDDVLHRVHKQRPSLPTCSLHLFCERLFSFEVVNISLVGSQVVEIIISGFGSSIKPPDVPVTLDPSLFCILTSNRSWRNGDSSWRIYSKQPIGLKRKNWAL